MKQLTIQKLAMAFALFSFGFVAIGSIMSGATYVTAILRGAGASLLFGGVAFALLHLMAEEQYQEPAPEMIETPESENS